MLEEQRVLDLQTGINFRELGGYQTKDNRRVKYRKAVRSAKLSTLDHLDLAYLQNYGILIDVDFRSDDELAKEPDKLPEGTQYRHLPVFDYDETKSSKTPQQLDDELRENPDMGYTEMLRVYRNMVTQKTSQRAYREFFANLLANSDDNQVLLFHCTAGKDRTGMGAFFLLSALGVPEATIEADYMLTNQTYKAKIDAILADAKAGGATDSMLRSIRYLSSVDIAFIREAEAEIAKTSGTTDQYLKDVLDLSKQDLQDLKQIYLTD